jgi:hypothetical protein
MMTHDAAIRMSDARGRKRDDFAERFRLFGSDLRGKDHRQDLSKEIATLVAFSNDTTGAMRSKSNETATWSYYRRSAASAGAADDFSHQR